MRFIKTADNPNPEPLIDYNQHRYPDNQYKELLYTIQEKGYQNISGMDDTHICFDDGYLMRFNLENGFPLITERDLMRASSDEVIANYKSDPNLRPVTGPLKQAIGEILAFINGARTQTELEDFGCKNFWLPWTVGLEAERKANKRGLDVGDLGPGSYGVAFHDFPTAEGETFNQFENLIAQIKDRPELKTHKVTSFIPQHSSRAPGRQQKALIVPCHGDLHFHVDIQSDTMKLTHVQRSADSTVGLPFNFVHYSLLLMIVGHVTGYRPTKLIHFLSDAQIYNRHQEMAEELISRPVYPFPKLYIDQSITNIFDFRVEHFMIEEYYANAPINMKGAAV